MKLEIKPKELSQNLNKNTHKISIIYDCKSFDITTLDEAILYVYASWSGPAIINLNKTLKVLDKKITPGKYLYLILILQLRIFKYKHLMNYVRAGVKFLLHDEFASYKNQNA